MGKDKEAEMWQAMDFCNGEIRVMAGRYGGGWLAAGCAVIEWDFDEEWSDLVSGDNDYFDARHFFENKEHAVLIEYANSPRDAFDLCINELINTVPDYERDAK